MLLILFLLSMLILLEVFLDTDLDYAIKILFLERFCDDSITFKIDLLFSGLGVDTFLLASN
jgi:hypothetical protein